MQKYCTNQENVKGDLRTAQISMQLGDGSKYKLRNYKNKVLLLYKFSYIQYDFKLRTLVIGICNPESAPTPERNAKIYVHRALLDVRLYIV